MAEKAEEQCTLLLNNHIASAPAEQELAKRLESKDDNEKIAALKDVITLILNGEVYPKLMMAVIKFCIHTTNHFIKKLLYIYWEVVNKKDAKGNLIPEMILVCNALKNDLCHPNEYVRGCCLRFLCKIKEPQILESLMPSIIANLDHRHSYVRKNAVLTVCCIFESCKDLVEEAPTLVENFLSSEANPCAKRNAFLMLFHHDQEKAVIFLNSILETVTQYTDGFQLLVLELIRKVCRGNAGAKSHYIRCVHALVNSSSNAVSYEGANTLVALSNQPTAVRAAVSAYCNLLRNESDPNVKLVILNRLSDLKKRNEKILQEMLMDILRILDSPSVEIRAAVLKLTVDLITARTVDAVVLLFKKELQKVNEPSRKGVRGGYRKLVVDSLHQFSVRFPEIVGKVVMMLLQHLSSDDDAALDVVYYVRDILSHYPLLRNEIVTKLLVSFDDISTVSVYRVALWILGEFSEAAEVLDGAFRAIDRAIYPLPLLEPPVVEESGDEKKDSKEPAKEAKSMSKRPALNSDGSYASQSSKDAKSSEVNNSIGKATKIRDFIKAGEYFLATSVVSTLTKLVLRFQVVSGCAGPAGNTAAVKALLIFSSILRYGMSDQSPKKIDSDSVAHIVMCTKIVLNPNTESADRTLFLKNGKIALHKMVERQLKQNENKQDNKNVLVVNQVDECISIRQLKKQVDYDYDDDLDLTRALGVENKQDSYAKLNRIYQLTGFDDPVYVEAQLSVTNYDIVLALFVVNQTKSTLQNLSVELHTSGDLKIIDRPRTFTVPAGGSVSLNANIKVASTESGVIFGNVVYDSPSGAVKTIVELSNVHMDIIDYIAPASCSDADFRLMWSEFEWENKLAVITDEVDLNEYLEHVTKITNMRCMTNDNSMSGSCNFLAANLYARSIFGEDALLNMSVEKQSSGKITGYIRIRSKTQGIALSLGDKITQHQRSNKKADTILPMETDSIGKEIEITAPPSP